MNACIRIYFVFFWQTKGVLWCQSHSRNETEKIPYEKLLWQNYFPATQRKTAKQNWVQRTQRKWKQNKKIISVWCNQFSSLCNCVCIFQTCNSRTDENENKKMFQKKKSKEIWMASIADLRLHLSRREGENAAERWCPSQQAIAVTSRVHPGIFTISQMRQGCERERLHFSWDLDQHLKRDASKTVVRGTRC